MTRKAKQPSRKRKGRSKPLPKACIPQPMEGERESMPLPRQRGPTAPPTATRMDMELIEPIDRALGRGAAHLTAPPSTATEARMRAENRVAPWIPLIGKLGKMMKGINGPPWFILRPFADQQPRILSQMEREDWRARPQLAFELDHAHFPASGDRWHP